MSEKIYACLLHLLAPQFQREYGKDAIQLFRDRYRDELGFIAKLRLWVDLLTDLAICATRDCQFGNHMLIRRMPGGHRFGRIPSFQTVRGEPPDSAALLLGGLFSLVALGTLPLLIGHGGNGGRPTQPRNGQVAAASPRNTHLALMSALVGAIGPAERKRVIDSVIANLREHYVYPNVARKMIDALLTHERNEDYEKETDGAAFAALLTKQLQDVSHDLHLRVAFSAAEVPDHPPGPEGDARFRSMLKRENCGFRKVEVLPHNIGYVKFDGFGPLSLCRDTGAAAMQFLAHVEGLIFVSL